MAASGPWRTSGDWWRENPWRQDEWDLEIRFEGSRARRPRESLQRCATGLYRLYYDALLAGLVRAGSVRLMYVELHARSAFSFLEGASLPEELAAVCAEYGMPAMALLDRDGVYGAPRLHLAAKKISFRAHAGAEVTSEEGWRYPLLVESREGYQNLCRLITRMKLRARKGEGHVLPEELAERSAGLICLTGGEEGPLAHALARGGNAAGIGMRAAALRTLRPRQCLRGIAAAFLAARKKRAIRRRWRSRGNYRCRCWRPTAFAMRARNSGNCSMRSPAFAITARWRLPGGC